MAFDMTFVVTKYKNIIVKAMRLEGEKEILLLKSSLITISSLSAICDVIPSINDVTPCFLTSS